MTEIRPCHPTDYEAITEIYRYYVEETDISFETEAPGVAAMSRRLREISSKYPCLVAETDGEIAGYCYVHLWKERAAYAGTLETTVYLHPDFTGRGIGRMLMERLIDLCRGMGVDALIACITYGNESSCRLHRSLGFELVSHFKGVGRKFGRRLDVVDYELTLNPSPQKEN